MPALSRAIDGGVVLVGSDGSVDFVSDSSSDLLGSGEEFQRRWSWVQERIDASLDRGRLIEDGESSFDISLPDELGGERLFIRVLPVDDEDCAGYLAVVKPRRSLDALQADLRLASQMRRVALSHQQAAHDIRAPLNAITLNLDLARQQLAEVDDAEAVVERVEIVGREVSRLARMVHMLVSQSGAPREAVRRFDLRRLVREVVSLVRPQAKAAGVAVHTEMVSEAVQVLGTRDHLKQALVNLVVNGLEAMPDGGRLELSLARGDSHSVLAIRDTGVGIRPEDENKLFKLHFTTKSTGTGIGLFTSRATIQSLGGTLELVSHAECGAVARVVLPLAGFEPEQEIACSTS